MNGITKLVRALLGLDVNADAGELHDALNRYREERFAYNEVERRVIPLIEKLAQAKLDAWLGYTRVFAAWKSILCKPKKLTYASHREIYLGDGDIEKLEEIARLVMAIKARKLNRLGNGLLTAVALCGGAATVQRVDEAKQASGSKSTVLDELLEKSAESEFIGHLDERAVLKNILHLPRVMQDQDLMEEEKLKEVSREEANRVLAILDARATELSEFREKLDHLTGLLLIVYDRFSLLVHLEEEAMLELEKLVRVKQDYTNFTQSEKNNFAYVLVLGHYIRKLAKLDLVLQTVGKSLLNMREVHLLFREIQDLLPIEEQYALPEDQRAVNCNVEQSAAEIQKELRKLREEIEKRALEKNN